MTEQIQHRPQYSLYRSITVSPVYSEAIAPRARSYAVMLHSAAQPSVSILSSVSLGTGCGSAALLLRQPQQPRALAGKACLLVAPKLDESALASVQLGCASLPCWLRLLVDGQKQSLNFSMYLPYRLVFT